LATLILVGSSSNYKYSMLLNIL